MQQINFNQQQCCFGAAPSHSSGNIFSVWSVICLHIHWLSLQRRSWGLTSLVCVRWQSSWWPSPMRAGSTCLIRLRSTLGGSEYCCIFFVIHEPHFWFYLPFCSSQDIKVFPPKQELCSLVHQNENYRYPCLWIGLANCIHHWRLTFMSPAQSLSGWMMCYVWQLEWNKWHFQGCWWNSGAGSRSHFSFMLHCLWFLIRCSCRYCGRLCSHLHAATEMAIWDLISSLLCIVSMVLYLIVFFYYYFCTERRYSWETSSRKSAGGNV